MGWIVGLALFGLVFPGINNWAHGGGIAAGVLIGFLAGYEENRAETALHRALSATVVILNAAVLAWASVRAFYLAFF
jgi:rhomboid protease GluP